MSILTAEEITNLYLYGTTTTPANLADESLIRPRNTTPLEISVDGNTFMQTGPGRIALPVLWEVVNEFFDLNRGVQPGTYTEQQLRTMFGISDKDATKTLQQYNYDDGLDSYAERTYIWNSEAYEIDDNAMFVVDQNGNRHIEHFAIKLLGVLNGPKGSHGGILDNFDFEGGGLAQILNGTLEKMIDPSGIGIKFNIEITNVTNFRTYTIADFVADTQKYNAFYVDTTSALLRIGAEGYDLINQLFDSGSIRFLDGDNKPILYGSDQGDIIQGTVSRTGVDIADTTHPLSAWTENGIHYIGGAGDDIVEGTGYDDKLFGGDDNDILIGLGGDDALEGGKGNDRLFGEDGNDTLTGGQGDDTYTFIDNYGIDVITDSDGLGSITIDGQTLDNADQKAEDIYKNDGTGYLVVKVSYGNTLIIGKEGDTNRIVINTWSEAKNLGISLQDVTPTLPATTLAGDFKKLIDDHGTPETGDDTYVMSNGNYTADKNAANGEANALDLITGTAGNDVIDGKGGSDALSGKAGDDYIEGGAEGDILQGGLGEDTLNGGAGDDAIYGASDADLNKPTDVNFTRPVNTHAHPQATGFNWTSGYDTTLENGVPYSFSTAPRNRLADDSGNLIDGGTGDDFIAAGTGADSVHGGEDKDKIWGMDNDDILFGDDGNDVIYGDGNEQNNDPTATGAVWTLPENHGNDIIDGGEGDDILYGQGGHDILDGGIGTDTLDGGTGTDTYIFNPGDGRDSVTDPDKDSILVFGAGITKNNIILRLGSLLLDLGNGDEIHIDGFDQYLRQKSGRFCMNSADFCGLENPIINIKLLCIFAERIDNPARVFARPENSF